MDCCLVLIAIICPPIAVIFKSGLCTADFLINVLLTMIGYVPGLIHAFFIISRPTRRYRDFDQEGRLYITVAPSECTHQRQGCNCQHQGQNTCQCSNRSNTTTSVVSSYGTINEGQSSNPPPYSVVENSNHKL